MSQQRTPESRIPVRLEPHSPTWAARFEAEKTALLIALKSSVEDIQHFGSTSVPGMSAKPTVDILIGIATFPWQHDDVLETLGYSFYKAPHPSWRVYLKPYRDNVRGYHLHIVKHDSEHWRSHLLFRDYLREHPLAAATYSEEKLRLAERFQGERGKYQAGKKSIVDELMTEAKTWRSKASGKGF